MLRAVRRVSIERRLPLLISLLLIVVIAALAGSAVREVRRLAIAEARARLRSVTKQFATSNTDGNARRLAALAGVAGNDSIRRYLAGPAGAVLEPVVGLTLRRLSADTPTAIGAELRDSRGTPVLAAGDTALMRSLPSPELGEVGRYSPLVRSGADVGYAVSTPVRQANRTVGYLIQWRRLNTSPRIQRAITDFVGHDAGIYYGNPSHDVWIDLSGLAAEPPPATDSGGYVEFSRTGKGLQLAMVQPIEGTAWMIEVDFPRASVLGGMALFLRRLGIVAGLVLVLGASSAWLASRHITKPLQKLTDAAEAIASGDFSRPVTDDSHDEVGRLSRAFRVMAERVQATQQGLEEKVTVRTRELREAMHSLEEAQDELVRKERLALLGQLSSSVGHELRNPLGVMNNAVYYLEAVLPDAPETAKEYLGILRAQISVSEKIISDLLDFARIRKPEQRRIPLEGLIAEQVQGHGVPANIRLARELSPEVPAVYADPVHVAQILRNLASNAFQAMEAHGGTLTIRTGDDGPGNVRIEVADTGPGIAPELIDKVFEPLFTTKARGIGLGLPVSRTLAAANGGSLTVTSRPGEGATFTLILPAPGGPGL